MSQWFEFLLRHPIVLAMVAIWLLGAIGNANKAKQRRRSRAPAPRPAEETSRPVMLPSAEPQPRPRPPAAPSPVPRSADEVAREMRRILGLDPDPAPQVRRVEPEPPPFEVVLEPRPAAKREGERRFESHVDPHVGDAIRQRHLASPGRKTLRRTLADRAPPSTAAAGAERSRFAAGALRQAIVLSEILARPLALRPHDERLLQ